MEKELDLPEGCEKWKPESLPKNFTVIITAKRRSGKTTMLHKIIYPLRKRFDEVYLFSLTADLMDKSEFSYIPEENKILGVDEEKLQEIFDKQKEILQRNNKIEDKRYHTKNNILILLDDVISDNKTRSSKILGRVFSAGRHSNLSLVLLTQDFAGKFGVSTLQRRNADCVISFFQHNSDDRDSMAMQYASVLDKKQGADYLKRVTNNAFTTAVIDATNNTARSYQEYIYWYKVDTLKIPAFMIQSKSKTLKKPKKVKKEKKKVSRLNIRTESDVPESLTFGIRLKETTLPIYDI